MHVLMVIASMSRCAAGVAASVQSLCRSLNSHCSVSVMSVKDEFSDADRRAWQPMEPQVLAARGPRWFGYSPDLQSRIGRTDAAVVHSHGIWMYPDLAVRRAATRSKVPWLISPHGMLDAWALRNSRWKKKLAGWLFTNETLRRAACLHALCESEYRSIRAYGLNNPVAIIASGVDLPDRVRLADCPPEIGHDGDARKMLLFMGRIHAKKGIENLIRAWATLKSQRGPVDQWRLVIAGQGSDECEAGVKRLTRELAVEESVAFIGPVYGNEKRGVLLQADAFVLPSSSEGLPMAVLEAWSYGLPTVLTPQCNLPEGFEAGAAIEVGPDADSIAKGLASLFSLPASDRARLGANGRRLVESRFDWPKAACEMMHVYEWIQGAGPRPACVRVD